MDGLGGLGSIWQEFAWGAFCEYRVCVDIPYHFDKWNAPEVALFVSPSSQDCYLRYGDECVVRIVDVNFVVVEHCDVVGIGIFSCAEERVLADAWRDVQFVGWWPDVEWICCILGDWDDVAVG